ncbi:hypothetical protein RFW18_20545 [Metabacillus idriensis]|uniref:hypothetical protein n=1 Tax=Metabacillus idriensis TaxID=324768 RepID=UPI0028130FE3|nr:hypothetical protein [Metabacillus idriensis]MDR0140156.1 hypothetical protein [Metabacillus idriensis]
MKQSTGRILDTFPVIKGKMNAYENSLSAEEAMEGLNPVEATFLRLAWYFEDPEHQSFDIGLLYRQLDNDMLELALELMALFFKEDTFLIKKPGLSFVRKGSNDFFSQKQFADYLKENGLNFDKSKLNVYYRRGKIPEPELDLAGRVYWSKTLVERFCEKEKGRLKSL